MYRSNASICTKPIRRQKLRNPTQTFADSQTLLNTKANIGVLYYSSATASGAALGALSCRLNPLSQRTVVWYSQLERRGETYYQ